MSRCFQIEAVSDSLPSSHFSFFGYFLFLNESLFGWLQNLVHVIVRGLKKQSNCLMFCRARWVSLAYGGCARSMKGSQNRAACLNNTITVFFLAANKNKDNAQVASTDGVNCFFNTYPQDSYLSNR